MVISAGKEERRNIVSEFKKIAPENAPIKTTLFVQKCQGPNLDLTDANICQELGRDRHNS